MLSFDDVNEKIWSVGEKYLFRRHSRLLSQNQLDKMIEGGLEVISSGPMFLLPDKEIFLDLSLKVQMKE